MDTNIIVKSDQEIIFHPVYSSGTAVVRGEQAFAKNLHHFWEMKMLSNLYGTDVVSLFRNNIVYDFFLSLIYRTQNDLCNPVLLRQMVGVGTKKTVLADWRYRFFSVLGYDSHSWGYSYNGTVQHDSQLRHYSSKFGLGSLIGVHLDMVAGTLEFYLNRKPLGCFWRATLIQIYTHAQIFFL